ncbi:MAG: para-aminobenzoate synthase, (PABA) [Vezdaea aestivalis]|nr:MAG: para-aminobenzoate synthase, (PABA) [Vezdaea aestivalis]
MDPSSNGHHKTVNREDGPQSRNILFVDAYDSFSNNIIDLLETELDHVEVTKVTIDDYDIFDNSLNLTGFDAVVVGPGPGRPDTPEDVGFIPKLWALDDDKVLPILGICLGFQSLAHAHGAGIRQLDNPQHGMVLDRLDHTGESIFDSVGAVTATKYHSLAIGRQDAEHQFKDWPSSLNILAWESSDDNGLVLMAIKHRSKPYYGLQYHPESICSNAEARRVVSNWWKESLAWNRQNRPIISQNRLFRGIPKSIDPALDKSGHPFRLSSGQMRSVEFRKISTREEINAASLCEYLQLHLGECILLDSASASPLSQDSNRSSDEPSSDDKDRYSILGLLIADTSPIVRYKIGDTHISLDSHNPTKSSRHSRSSSTRFPLATDGTARTIKQLCESVQTFLSSFMAKERAHDGDPLSPFWGGLMGYISYEFGVASIGVEVEPGSYSDIALAFVEKSIVIDHGGNSIWIQSIREDDVAWIGQTSQLITQFASRLATNGLRNNVNGLQQEKADSNGHCHRAIYPQIEKEHSYQQKVMQCQSEIAAGESYELCLTSQAYIRIARDSPNSELSDWQMYKQIRKRNPAPFAAYLRFADTTVISSSPERFLKWTRNGKCDMRPIKGTVSKSIAKTLKQATAILDCEKERAENLMIVDLVRHDLHGICGPGRVLVKKLMNVEEYATVFQLVTTVEGYLPWASLPSSHAAEGSTSSAVHAATKKDLSNGYYNSPTGIDVLFTCLPPGSMTGAPKKRSCAILSEIEEDARGIYSGALGYICVGGAGDFAVIIRTAVRHHENERPGFEDLWTFGAGGAITILSDPADEYEEMKTKLDSTVRAFDPSLSVSS